ncbi:hypothetical protein ACRBEV_01765 [Methylobacterium phyllosphaerae]
MLDQPGRYLLAAPRTALADEHAAWLGDEARARGMTIRIETVHAAQGKPDVPRRIADACQSLSQEAHAILIITHEALRSIDLSPFTEADVPWDVRVDEIPDSLASGTFKAPASAQYLGSVYDLALSDVKGWWRATLKPDAPAPNALMVDTHLRDLVAFDKRARSHHGGGVLVDVGDWRDATLKDRTVHWYSAWTPAALSGFASVEMAGANFGTSLCGLASERLDAGWVEYSEEHLGAGQRQARPTVVLRYFTHAHTGSTEWWAAGLGKRHLNKVLRHLTRAGDLGYYSGNECVTSYFEGWLDHAEAVRPKQAGTNSLIQHTSCAFIYSNKAQTADNPIRVALGFTADEIKRARETEDMIQFAMRGAVRNPTFTGTYTVYLYDRAQADALGDYLRANGVTDDVRIEGVEEAGILDAQRPASRHGKKGAPEAEGGSFAEREQARLDADADRKRRKRAQKRAEQEANGTLRKRGRPRKDASGSGVPATP